MIEVLAWIGLPPPILLAWTGAIQSFSRRFQIWGSLSAPVFSTAGYPEVDALSCVAMVAVDLLLHAWRSHFFHYVIRSHLCGRLATDCM